MTYDYKAIAEADNFFVDDNGEGEYAWYNIYLYFGSGYEYSSEEEAYKDVCKIYKLIKEDME